MSHLHLACSNFSAGDIAIMAVENQNFIDAPMNERGDFIFENANLCIMAQRNGDGLVAIILAHAQIARRQYEGAVEALCD